MSSPDETREALKVIAAPLLEAHSEVFVAFCPKEKVYVGATPSEECRACKTTHENHSVKSLEDLQRLDP